MREAQGGDAMNSDGPTGFVTLTAAAAWVGIARQTLAGRVRLGLLPSFSDPRDRRFVLLRLSDVEGMSTPQPRPAHRVDAVGG